MRISDWSSDVCSSDLVEQLVIFDPARNDVVAFADVEQDRVVRFQALGAMEGKARDLDVREPRYLSAEGIQQVITPQDVDFQLVSLLLAPLPGDTLQELGRASCRDRVCQYA